MKILELKAQNVKRLSAVEITPDGHVVEIAGANGAGKSSVLDSIMYGLAGKKSLPAEPLRRGEKAGQVSIKLDGDESNGLQPMIVTRTFGKNGRSTLKITSADGYEAPSPQAILDELCGRIAFDPLEFTRQSAKQQIETLKAIAGLDFTEADRKWIAIFDERRIVNRDVKALQARMDAATTYENAPAVEVSVADLSVELTRRIKVNQENTRLINEENAALRIHAALLADTAELERQLIESRKLLNNSEADAVSLHKKVAGLRDEDHREIQTQISTAEETNRQVRANQVAQVLEEEYKVKATTSDGLTQHIDDIAADKARQLGEAVWPVSGLGFDENGVTFDGLPFEQASSAERLRVSVAMGFALNPTLRVLLIRDG